MHAGLPVHTIQQMQGALACGVALNILHTGIILVMCPAVKLVLTAYVWAAMLTVIGTLHWWHHRQKNLC